MWNRSCVLGVRNFYGVLEVTLIANSEIWAALVRLAVFVRLAMFVMAVAAVVILLLDVKIVATAEETAAVVVTAVALTAMAVTRVVMTAFEVFCKLVAISRMIRWIDPILESISGRVEKVDKPEVEAQLYPAEPPANSFLHHGLFSLRALRAPLA